MGWRDYLGIVLVGVGLLVGVGIAVYAYQLAPPEAVGPEAARTPGVAGADAHPDVGLGDREHGRVVFGTVCQDCHDQGRQAFNPATRERVRLVQTRIREGVGQMPAFPPSRLADEDLRAVLAYIATPAGPEPTPTPEPRVRGVRFEIVEASGRAGEPPVVHFRVRDDAGAEIAPADMTALTLTVAGPTVDYRWVLRQDARRAERLPDGSARQVFTTSLPAEAHGTFAAAVEGYLQHPPASPGAPPLRDTGYNPVSYFAVTDPVPISPRLIVRTETCNGCHGTLATHGGARRNTEFCVMCHNASTSDAEKRATAGGPTPPEPVQFRNLIHRIHTGEDLQQSFVVYGGPPANPNPVDLAAVHPFPGDRANCATCHEPGTFTITRPLEQSAPMTVAVGDQVVRQVPPITAACTGCHDGPRTAAHAAAMTSPLGVETCATCHGDGRPNSVTSVHRVPAGPSR
jgi:OmcA/MtrC family decaheme c-type cytochrome